MLKNTIMKDNLVLSLKISAIIVVAIVWIFFFILIGTYLMSISWWFGLLFFPWLFIGIFAFVVFSE
jgi:hypothetical protein